MDNDQLWHMIRVAANGMTSEERERLITVLKEVEPHVHKLELAGHSEAGTLIFRCSGCPRLAYVSDVIKLVEQDQEGLGLILWERRGTQ